VASTAEAETEPEGEVELGVPATAVMSTAIIMEMHRTTLWRGRSRTLILGGREGVVGERVGMGKGQCRRLRRISLSEVIGIGTVSIDFLHSVDGWGYELAGITGGAFVYE